MEQKTVFISATQTLGDLGVRLSDCLCAVNAASERYGITFVSSTVPSRIDDSDIAFILFWKDLDAASCTQFKTAYACYRERGCPKTWVFFKEPDKEITQTLQSFKNDFEERYGYFVCRFDSEETLRFHFIEQCFIVVSSLPLQKCISVNDGKITIGNISIRLNNISFAASNDFRKMLLTQIANAKAEESRINASLPTYGTNPDKQALLREVQLERQRFEEELKSFDKYLLDAELYLAKRCSETIDDRVQEAKRLFDSGRSSEAKKLFSLSDIRIEDKYEQSRKSRIDNIADCLLNAKLLMVDMSVPTERRFAEASESYECALGIANDIEYLPSKTAEIHSEYATLLENQGLLVNALGHREDAVALLQQTIQDFEEGQSIGEKKNPDKWFDIVLDQENLDVERTNIADILYRLGRYDESESILDRVLETQRIRARMAPTIWHLDTLAHSLVKLGNQLMSSNNLSKAEEYISEARDIRRNLVLNGDTERFNPKLAKALIFLGSLHVKMDRLAQAKQEFSEACRIYSELIARDRTQYEESYAGCMNDQAELFCQMGQREEALKAYNISLEIFKRLYERDPIQYESTFATVLCNVAVQEREIADAHSDDNELERAERNFTKAISHFDHLVQLHGKQHEKELARTLGQYALLLEKRQMVDLALKTHEKALAIYKSHYKDAPDIFGMHVARVAGNYGEFLIKLERLDAAETQITLTLSLYRELEVQNKGAYGECIVQALHDLADIDMKRDNYLAAEQKYKESISFMLSGASVNRVLLAHSWGMLGYTLVMMHRWEDAHASYSEANIAWQTVADVNPRYRSEVARTAQNMGVCAQYLQNNTEAKKQFLYARAIYAALDKETPGMYANNILGIESSLAMLEEYSQNTESNSNDAPTMQQYCGETTINESDSLVFSNFHDIQRRLDAMGWHFIVAPTKPHCFVWTQDMSNSTLWNEISCQLDVYEDQIEVIGWLNWRDDFAAPQERLIVFANMQHYYESIMGSKVRIGITDQEGEGPVLIRFGMSFSMAKTKRMIASDDEGKTKYFGDIINVPQAEMSWWSSHLCCLFRNAEPQSYEDMKAFIQSRAPRLLMYLKVLLSWDLKTPSTKE